MQGLGEFLEAVRHHWIALMSGVIALAMSGWEKVRGKDITAGVFLLVGGLSLFWACFRAWKDEREKASRLATARFGLTTSTMDRLGDAAANLATPYRANFMMRNVGSGPASGVAIHILVVAQPLLDEPVPIEILTPNDIVQTQEYPFHVGVPRIERNQPGWYFVITVSYHDAMGRSYKQTWFRKWAGARAGTFLTEIIDTTVAERDAILARFPRLVGAAN